VTTRLDGPLKRAITVDGVEYTLTIDPGGLKLVAKGHRKGQALTWSALVSGEAALATALNASLAAATAVAAPPKVAASPPRKSGRRRQKTPG
jgi:hypothetical protein